MKSHPTPSFVTPNFCTSLSSCHNGPDDVPANVASVGGINMSRSVVELFLLVLAVLCPRAICQDAIELNDRDARPLAEVVDAFQNAESLYYESDYKWSWSDEVTRRQDRKTQGLSGQERLAVQMANRLTHLPRGDRSSPRDLSRVRQERFGCAGS